MRVYLAVGIGLIATLLTIPVARASGIDLHWLWDDRCAACHGHAGNFARKFLSVSSDELQGRHHVRDLRRFLHNHYLAGNEVDAVYNMLRAQANTRARFEQECAACHDTAAMFVRNTMVLRDGVLYSRNSGRMVSRFLGQHMNLTPEDVEFFLNLLMRVTHEVYRP